MRKTLRQARRALDDETRASGERAICRRILGLGAYRQARTVAVYYAFDGEPSIARVAEAAARHGKRVYAPVIVRQHMFFAPITRGALLRSNVFGIAEPALERLIDARHLDLVLAPLVGFDERGVRMGMGRGYYDRAFRFLRHRRSWTRPKLIGVAWSFQQVPELPKQPWDIPLSGAVTELAFHRFGGDGE
ncbi:MAG TPA: 5-formyltetrahydrofolate cyclo-ligase [Gammaproteobacteria bacterium]